MELQSRVEVYDLREDTSVDIANIEYDKPYFSFTLDQYDFDMSYPRAQTAWILPRIDALAIQQFDGLEEYAREELLPPGKIRVFRDILHVPSGTTVNIVEADIKSSTIDLYHDDYDGLIVKSYAAFCVCASLGFTHVNSTAITNHATNDISIQLLSAWCVGLESLAVHNLEQTRYSTNLKALFDKSSTPLEMAVTLNSQHHPRDTEFDRKYLELYKYLAFEKFMWAARNEDVVEMKRILRGNHLDMVLQGDRILLLTAALGSDKAIELLLKDGRVDPRNIGILKAAVGEGHIGIVKLLLDDGRVDPNSNVRRFGNILSYALASDQLGAFELLLNDGRVDPNTRPGRDEILNMISPQSAALLIEDGRMSIEEVEEALARSGHMGG